MSRITHSFQTQNQLLEMLSKSIVMNLKSAIKNKGKATLMVSGGNTPIPLFKKLRETTLDWEKVSVGLCDERWVPSDHDDSNEKLVKTYLLQDQAKKAKFIGMYNEDLEVHKAEKWCTQKVNETLFPFDVVVLGMGSDAHTASLFPNNDKLEKAFDLDYKDLCIAIEPETAPYKRMSLTLSAILSASNVYLHFEGEEKIDVYREAIDGVDRYNMPIRAVVNQDIKDLEVYYT